MSFHRFKDKHTIYKWYELEDFIKENKDELNRNVANYYKDRQKYSYYNLPMSYDIETTAIEDGDNEYAYCYLWQFDIDGYVFIGRSLREFKCFLADLRRLLNLHETKRIVVYVHNLAYEFQFLKDLFNWTEIFALSKYKPIRAVAVDYGVEFRCSYKLSNLSLESLSEFTDSSKLVGALDYDLKRNSHTPLTDRELRYAVYDVEVVVEYIRQMISDYDNLHKVPMTSTGKVRKAVKSSVLKSDKYKYTVQGIKIKSAEELRVIQRAFTGGFTHANHNYVGNNCFNLTSFDLTSSYPATICGSYFPMSNGRKVKIKSRKQFNYLLKHNCVIFEAKFHNINSKISFEHLFSYHKCYNVVNPTVDNGRIVGAAELTIVLTEVDFKIAKRCYSWDKMQIGVCYSYKRGYLPKEFIECVLEWYGLKTTLKGVADKEKQYALYKTYVNALYGCMVTKIDTPEIELIDGEWTEKPKDVETVLSDYNDNKARFLCYQWGIYVTAHARAILWDAIFELGNDYVYADTDSVKFFNYEKHAKYFEQANDNIIKGLENMCNATGIDFDKCKPKTVKGVEKPLGVWDYDGSYKVFKTLGAKRYVVLTDNYEFASTIAGLGKTSGRDYLTGNYGKYGAFRAFRNELSIDPEYTGKLTHKYIDLDETKHIDLTDYTGYTERVEINSCVYLTGAPFTLTLSELFKRYLLGYRDEVQGI